MADLRSRSTVTGAAANPIILSSSSKQQQQGAGGGLPTLVDGIDIDHYHQQQQGQQQLSNNTMALSDSASVASPLPSLAGGGGGHMGGDANTNNNTINQMKYNNNTLNTNVNANNATTSAVVSGAIDMGGVSESTAGTATTGGNRMSRYADIVGHKRLQLFRELGEQQGIAALLDSNLGDGVAGTSVAARMAKHGRNVLPTPDPQSLWDFIKEALEDKTLLILIGAAVLSLVLGMTTPDPRTGEVDRSTGWIEGAAILLSVAIVTLIGSVNNYQKQNQFAGLVESADRLRAVSVIRDGRPMEVDSSDVVVGDLVRLYGGMTFSFDALLVRGDGFACDESNLTGEADRVPKTVHSDPFLLSGTSVTDGCEGVALVVAVGVSSYSGAIHSAVCEESKDQTPLQEKLEGMADTIGKFGLVAAIITFVILTLKESFHVFVLGHTFYAMKIFENITTAVAIVVVAVPEGLPLSVTISLAYSMKRMLQDKNLVRHLAACETMGGATTICTDKTGTLTMSDMYLRSLYIGGKLYDNLHSQQSNQSPSSPRWDVDANPQTIKMLLDCVAHNTMDMLGGNKTSNALVVTLDGLRDVYSYDALAAAKAVSPSARIRFPFSSANKRSSAVVKSGSVMTHYVIGAAELVLQSCTHYYSSSGAVEPLSGHMRSHIEGVSVSMMSSGLRTLAIAVSERSTSWGELPSSPPEEPLRLVAFAGIEEPLRPEVPAAIATSHRAGIRVMMLTGDSLPTAKNIARRCGIRVDDEGAVGGNGNGALCMEGTVFRSLSDQELLHRVIPHITVLARATPLDKKRMVNLLKSNPTEVVAVTGDGTNDAPALKAADVGFAMNSGSDVAKRASDIVLLDDNYVGMVKATMWGRNVKANIRKFIQFQLTVNVAACIVAIIGAVLNSQNLSPLKPVQLLWLNLIMDTLAALALATELPSRDLLERGVEKKDSPIVTPAMWLNVATQSSFQLLTQMVLLLGADNYFGVKEFSEEHLALVFNVFVMMQIFNFFNARLLSGEHGLFHDLDKSTFMLAIVAIIFISQVLIMQFAGRFFSVTALDGRQWAISIAIGAVSLPLGALTRGYQRRRDMREVGGGEDMVARVNDVLMGAYGRLMRCIRPAKKNRAAE